MAELSAQRTNRLVNPRRTLAFALRSRQLLIHLLGILLVLQPGHVAFAAGEQKASASSFRVTGVVAVGEADWMVLLEAEDGAYHRIRVGDALAGGEVLAIGPRWMRIAFGEREETWRLTPGEAPAVPKRAAKNGSGKTPELTEPSGPMRTLKSATVDALKLEATHLRQTNRGANGSPEDTARQLFDLLDPLLDFQMPTGGAVVSVNEHPPVSLSTAVEAIIQGIEQGGPVSLNVRNESAASEEAEGMARFYLVPDTQNTQ
jgi:hypothetical protein